MGGGVAREREREGVRQGSDPLSDVAVRFRHPLEHGMSGQPSSPTGRTSHPRLNVVFVEWLMGWPEGWADATEPLASTSFESWETASCLLLRQLLGESSPDDLPVADLDLSHI
jgi:hypothetical protein